MLMDEMMMPSYPTCEHHEDELLKASPVVIEPLPLPLLDDDDDDDDDAIVLVACLCRISR